jgi:hypothetical protein
MIDSGHETEMVGWLLLNERTDRNKERERMKERKK